MNDVMIDNPPSSSSFQPSDSNTPTTSSVQASSNTLAATGVTSARRIPSSGPIIAGILAGTIVIATIVTIIFVKRRHRRSRRRHYPFEAQISLQSGSHVHRLSRTPKQKYHGQSHHSRHSSTNVGPDVVPQAVVIEGERRSRSKTHESSLPSDDRKLHSSDSSTGSTLSPAHNTDTTGDNQPNHTVVDERQISAPSSTLSSETVSSNQLEQYPPGPTLRTELPPQLPSSSSQNENPFQHPTTRNNSVLPPEARLQHLNALIQQRAILLASTNTSDKSIYNELLQLEEQIQILRRQGMSPPHQDEPPPYESRR